MKPTGFLLRSGLWLVGVIGSTKAVNRLSKKVIMWWEGAAVEKAVNPGRRFSRSSPLAHAPQKNCQLRRLEQRTTSKSRSIKWNIAEQDVRGIPIGHSLIYSLEQIFQTLVNSSSSKTYVSHPASIHLFVKLNSKFFSCNLSPCSNLECISPSDWTWANVWTKLSTLNKHDGCHKAP